MVSTQAVAQTTYCHPELVSGSHNLSISIYSETSLPTGRQVQHDIIKFIDLGNSLYTFYKFSFFMINSTFILSFPFHLNLGSSFLIFVFYLPFDCFRDIFVFGDVLNYVN